MAEVDQKKGRAFDSVAELYDRVRPHYPASMIQDLTSKARLDRNARILEIGTGTGQLTLPLAEAGFDITSIDTGPNLISVASRNLSGYSNAKLVCGDFDDFNFDGNTFDLVVAATSYHWLNPETRAEKVRGLLRKKGNFALIETYHVSGGSTSFFAESQDCYIRWDPNTVPGYELPPESSIKITKWKSELRKHFRKFYSGSYPLELEYDTEGYIGLLNTYSDILSMDVENREGLLECIETLINSRFGGSVRKRYLFELYLTTRRP